MHLAKPTSTSPSRRPPSSGRKAHASESLGIVNKTITGGYHWWNIPWEMAQWSSSRGCWNQPGSTVPAIEMCYVVFRILPCKGWDTSWRADRLLPEGVSIKSFIQILWQSCLPIGIETPTNSPFCKAGPMLSTKLPSRMPTIMASRIQRASSRSSQPKLLKADSLGARMSAGLSAHCRSISFPSLLWFDVSCRGSLCSCFIFACARGGEQWIAVMDGGFRCMRFLCSKRRRRVG